MNMRYEAPVAKIICFCAFEKLASSVPHDDEERLGRSSGGILEGSTGYDTDRG